MQATGVPSMAWPAAGTIYKLRIATRVHDPGQILQGSICMVCLGVGEPFMATFINMLMRLHYVGVGI